MLLTLAVAFILVRHYLTQSFGTPKQLSLYFIQLLNSIIQLISVKYHCNLDNTPSEVKIIELLNYAFMSLNSSLGL